MRKNLSKSSPDPEGTQRELFQVLSGSRENLLMCSPVPERTFSSALRLFGPRENIFKCFPAPERTFSRALRHQRKHFQVLSGPRENLLKYSPAPERTSQSALGWCFFGHRTHIFYSYNFEALQTICKCVELLKKHLLNEL